MTDHIKTGVDRDNMSIDGYVVITVEESGSFPSNIQFNNFYETRAAYQNQIPDKNSAYVSILVVGYNNLQEHTKYCVESILKYTTDIDYELVLLDNGSFDGTFEYYRSVPYPKKRIIRITQNKGGNYAVNFATNHLMGRYIVMIPNDVYVTKNWLSNMLKCAESHESIGFVAPASDNVSNFQSVNLPFKNLEEMQLKAEQYNISDPRKWEERLRLMPALGLYKKECLDIVGGLDYAFQHDFSDDDISIRIRRTGYRLVFCGDVFVHHVGPTVTGSSSKKKADILTTGRETFRQKYFGIDPWDDVNNFELGMLSLINPEDKRNTLEPKVLGINIKCGTPVLQLKNKLRLADIFDAKLSAFEEDAKYWLDLKTICDGVVAVDRIEHLTEHFSPNSFDYILSGKPINSYKGTEKILDDMLSLLKYDGQLLVKITNHFDPKIFIDSSGKDMGNKGMKFYSLQDINGLNHILTGRGFSITDIRRVLLDIDDAAGNAIRSVLNKLDGIQNADAAFNELVTSEYLLKISANRENRAERAGREPSAREKEPSNIDATVADRNSPPYKLKNKASTPGLTSIVIVTSNRLGYTKNCLASLQEYTPQPHEIIFVDIGSTDGTLKWLKSQVRDNKNWHLINKGGLEFAKGCNLGIEASCGEYVLFLDSQTLVTDGWLSKMLDCLERVPDAGVMVPMLNHAIGRQQLPGVEDLSFQDFIEYAKTFGERNKHRRTTAFMVDHACVLVRRTLIEKIGLFGEQYETPYGTINDFSFRALIDGYKTVIAADSCIYQDRKSPREKGSDKLFRERWNNINPYSETGQKLAPIAAIRNARENYGKGLLNEAIQAIMDGIKFVPDEGSLYYCLADILSDAKLYEQALEALQALPEDQKAALQALERFAVCNYYLGNIKNAQDYIDKALAVSRGSVRAINLAGLIAMQADDREQAEIFFGHAVKIDPGFADPYMNAGIMRWGMGKEKEALDLIEKAFILSPETTDFCETYHSAISSLGELMRAESIFREAIGLYPQNKILIFKHIGVLLQQEKDAQAMEEVQKAMIAFGIDDDILGAALQIRKKLGPNTVNKNSQKGSLSICMIVKNEEDKLARCLASLSPVAAEIIVVDTGSTDRTKDIARAFGARVFDFPWANDFSKARNFSMSQAKGRWILIHDADEVISARDYSKFNTILESDPSAPLAYSLVTRNYTSDSVCQGWTPNTGEYPDEETGRGWFPSPKVRLVPNDARFRFENPVHELLEPSLHKAGVQIKPCGIVIHHYSQANKERNEAKWQMYYDVGRKKLETQGDSESTLRELAVQARALGKYEEAIGLWKRYIVVNPRSYTPFFNMSSCYFETGQFDKALDAAREALRLNPRSKEAAQCYAAAALLSGDALDAIRTLEEILGTIPLYPTGKVTLAAAYLVSGMEEKGLEHLKEMRRLSYDCSGALHSLSQKLASAGKMNSAILLIEGMIKSGHVHPESAPLLEECRTRAELATNG